MKYFLWLLKAAIFFTLFAFALNNQQAVSVHFFFGTFWNAPLVLVVLAAFAIGLMVGVMGMVPYGRLRHGAAPAASIASVETAPSADLVPGELVEPPRRHGL